MRTLTIVDGCSEALIKRNQKYLKNFTGQFRDGRHSFLEAVSIYSTHLIKPGCHLGYLPVLRELLWADHLAAAHDYTDSINERSYYYWKLKRWIQFPRSPRYHSSSWPLGEVRKPHFSDLSSASSVLPRGYFPFIASLKSKMSARN